MSKKIRNIKSLINQKKRQCLIKNLTITLQH